MGKVKKFIITLNNQNGLYYPGQQVQGKCMVELSDSLKLRAIKVKINGYAFVYWTETQGSGDNEYTETYSSSETYIKEEIKLLDKAPGQKDDIVLPAGLHEYPFQFELPSDCPSSFEGGIGQVRYTIAGDIDIPWAINLHTIKLFTVATSLDLNKDPSWAKRGEAQGQKVLCCWCCASDPIECTLRVERLGYVPGEQIAFRAEIDNKSNRTMRKTTASLVQVVSFHAGGHTNWARNVISKLKHGKIEAGGSDQWYGEKFHVPPVPPSFLEGCSIININYHVLMTVDPAGPAFDLVVHVEVIIGSIPIQGIAQQYGMGSSSASGSALRNIYGSVTIPDNLPVPSYAESVMGRVNFNSDDADKATTYGSQQYAPLYAYYNWNQQNPATLFTVGDKRQ